MPFPSPGDLPDSGIEPRSPALQADALSSKPKYQGNNIPQPMTVVVSSLSHMFDNSEICVYIYTVVHGFILWLNFLGFHDAQFSSIFYVAPFIDCLTSLFHSTTSCYQCRCFPNTVLALKSLFIACF